MTSAFLLSLFALLLPGARAQEKRASYSGNSTEHSRRADQALKVTVLFQGDATDQIASSVVTRLCSDQLLATRTAIVANDEGITAVLERALPNAPAGVIRYLDSRMETHVHAERRTRLSVTIPELVFTPYVVSKRVNSDAPNGKAEIKRLLSVWGQQAKQVESASGVQSFDLSGLKLDLLTKNTESYERAVAILAEMQSE